MGADWQGVLNSSERMDWGTPQALFDALDAEFSFSLDAAAHEQNHKCAQYLSPDDDSLSCDWLSLVGPGASVWLNPPYGRGIGRWIRKAYEESQRGICVVVLVMVRSDTRWFRQWAMRAAEVRLIAGRVTFQGAKASAPAPSALLVFDEARRVPRFFVQQLPRKDENGEG